MIVTLYVAALEYGIGGRPRVKEAAEENWPQESSMCHFLGTLMPTLWKRTFQSSGAGAGCGGLYLKGR